MSALPAVKNAIVKVHQGVHIGKHHLGGVHLTVISTPVNGVLELSEYAGNRVYLLASDVDVITRPAGAA